MFLTMLDPGIYRGGNLKSSQPTKNETSCQLGPGSIQYEIGRIL